jgi:hypothetical protein
MYNGLSDHDAQLLTIKVTHHSYSIRNKYSMEEFNIGLSYEFWDSIFSKNDNVNVDSLFNIFLNSYLRIMNRNNKPSLTTAIKHVWTQL